MTTPTPYTGAPVSTASESPDWPASLWAYANTLDDQHVLYATSQSNRDALYANVRAGSLVSCALSSTTGILWMKTTTPPTAASWVVLAERQAAVTTGVVTAGTNFSVSSQWAQRVNGMISISAVLSYSGSTVTANSSGDLSPDVTVCTIQSPYLPPSGLLSAGWALAMPLNTTTGAGFINSSGDVKLLSLVPSVSLTSGATVRFSATFVGA